MRLLSLNIWGGRVREPLLAFLKCHSASIDIFCLQEVFHNGTVKTVFDGGESADIFSRISKVLPQHNGYFHPSEAGEWGPAMFIRETIDVERVDDTFVHRHRDAMVGNDASTLGRNLQYALLSVGNKTYTIGNFHGIWNGKDKKDSAERLKQSRNIKNFFEEIQTPYVLAGDFNLEPKTHSIKILERGARNLVAEHGITSTRSSLYTKEPKYADYIFTSSEITVHRFAVLDDEVSDHLPLSLDFE